MRTASRRANSSTRNRRLRVLAVVAIALLPFGSAVWFLRGRWLPSAERDPISRSLWIYVNRQPGAPLPKLASEFLLYVLSRDGAEAAVRDGFTALDSAAVVAERRKFE